jgi:hypothetical protein
MYLLPASPASVSAKNSPGGVDRQVVVVTTVLEQDLVELLLEAVDREEEGPGIRLQDGLGRWMIFEVVCLFFLFLNFWLMD